MSKNNQEVNRNWFFIILLTIGSLSLAGTAAYFSIFGLAKLFAGAGIGIIILASVLEFSKLVAVSYVYRYWKVIAKALRAYYIFGVVFIMLLTSIGIYGFLTNAYQNTANKVEVRDSQIKIAENKRTLFVAQLDRVNKSIESSNNRINSIADVRDQQETRLNNLYERDRTTSARRTEDQITSSDEQINLLNASITEKMKEASVVNDSIAYYDQKIVELKASDVSSEVGPLKYLSDLTGLAMNKIVNILVLLIIFVFDPMAISLLIGVNQLTMMEKGNSALKDEKMSFPKIGNIFRRKKKEENEKEETPPIKNDENESSALIQEPRKIPFFAKPFVQEYEPDEYQEEPEEIEEEIEPKKNEYTFEICPDGYKEDRINLNLSNIREGLKVYHDTFGNGTIIKSNIDNSRVFIKFEEGIKELSPEYANLKEIVCVKPEEMESVEYLDFTIAEPEKLILKNEQINENIISETSNEEEKSIENSPENMPSPDNNTPSEDRTPQDEQIVEQPITEPEKKTKFFQKIWRGKKIV